MQSFEDFFVTERQDYMIYQPDMGVILHK